MGIKVTVKAKFNASKEIIEKFGNNKYLMYLPFAEDHEANFAIVVMLSRHMGVPPSKIKYVGLDVHKDRIFEVL